MKDSNDERARDRDADRTTLASLGPLPQYVGYRLRQAQISVFTELIDRFAALDLRPAHFGTLLVIQANPGLSQADVCAALRRIRAVLAPGAPFVLEYATKHHLKAILRYWLRCQDWSPFDCDPVEFYELYFNFHPTHMARCLRECGFETRRKLAVSYFRAATLKRLVPANVLVALDRLVQPTGQFALYSPSVFTLNIAAGSTPPAALDGPLFKCPLCGALLYAEGDQLVCPGGDGRWAVRDGLYDFKDNLVSEKVAGRQPESRQGGAQSRLRIAVNRSAG